MMKKLLFLVFMILIHVIGFSQACGTFPPVKASWWGSPNDQTYGFSADSINLTNNDTAIFIQGEDTIFDYQYLMPKKYDATALSGGIIGVVDVQSISILGVNGLPNGINFNLDQAGYNAGNTYAPQSYRFGAVRLCGLTYATPGVYAITVNINATVSTPVGPQGGSLPITLYLKVVPSTSGNAFFSFSPGVGCDSAMVDFSANVTTANPILNPVEYDWDFGDGSPAVSGKNVTHNYVGANTYVVTQTTTIKELYVSAVSASISGTWYFQDVDDGFWLFGTFIQTNDADLEGSINSGGNGISLPEVGNNNNPSWTGLNFVLNDQSLAISYTEIDAVSSDDNGGLASLTINGPGTYPYTCLNGSTAQITGTITVSIRTQSTQVTTDTVRIYSQSATPTIASANGSFIACSGDTITLTSSVAESYQWYKDSVLLQGETNQTLLVSSNGVYSVSVIDSGSICNSLEAYVTTSFEVVATPVIMSTASGFYINNPNGYDVQWYANGSGSAIPIPNATGDSLSTFNPANQPFTVMVTSSNGCTALSAPYSLCLAGTSSADGNLVNLATSVEINHEDFVLNPGNDVAWAISTEADGPITDAVSLQAAIAAGWVIPSTTDSSVVVNCSSLPTGLGNGNFYFTPITAASLVIDSIIHAPDIDSLCMTDAQLCLDLSATPGVLLVTDSLIFTFPDGSTANLRDIVPASFQSLIPDTITKDLIDLLPSVIPGGALCFRLTDLYDGNPNGTWTIEALNVGTGTLTITYDDIVSTVYADSCPLITQDQVITIPGQTFTIVANSTASVSFTLPPLPSNFPTLNADCNVIGAATLLTIDCGTAIDDVIDVNSFALYPNPNNGTFTVQVELKDRSTIDMSIIDVTGRTVLSQHYNNEFGTFTKVLDLSNNMSVGFYVLNLNIDGNQIQKHFIVK